MARYVVKLGSSIVAEDSGALRPDVLARVCDQVAARHAAGDDVVVVTSGAIARGIQRHGPRAAADARSRTSRPPARWARASSTASTTSCCASAA